MTCSTFVRRMVVSIALLGHAASAGAADGIRWYRDLKEASQAAQKADLPMFIDFWADWCTACKVMDADVYTDAVVIEAFRRKMIGVRLHFDLQPDLARRFNVPALPYLLFTSSYGTPLMHQRGFLKAEDLSTVVDALPSIAEINRIDRRLQQDKDDFMSLLGMARALRTAGFFESSNSFYDRSSKHRAARTDAGARESILFDMSLNWIELQNGADASALLELCLKEFPKSTRRSDVLVALGRAYVLDEQNDKARKTLNSVITDYPRSPAAAQARTLLKSL